MAATSSPKRLVRTSQRSSWALGLLLPLGAGCSFATEEYSTSGAEESTQAVVRIQRTTSADGTSRGDALAGFVRLPASTDRPTALRLAGLQEDRVPPGTCRFRERTSDVGLSEFSRIRLLEADSVELLTKEGRHELAAHAFPAVTDWIRGVVYASRNRAAENLPSGEPYRLLAEGIEGVTRLDAWYPSPHAPADVTLGGRPWNEVANLPPTQFLDVTWTPDADSAPQDTLTVVLETGERPWTCAFADSEGAGSVPLVDASGARLVPAGAEVQFAIHRQRRATTEDPSGDGKDPLDLVEVQFDFAVTARIVFE